MAYANSQFISVEINQIRIEQALQVAEYLEVRS